MRSHVIQDLLDEIRYALGKHQRTDARSMVATALMAHTGLSFEEASIYKPGVFVLTNAKNGAAGRHFTLSELEEALKRAGINSRKK
jgi:uncharacterized protein (DUF2252 family)